MESRQQRTARGLGMGHEQALEKWTESKPVSNTQEDIIKMQK